MATLKDLEIRLNNLERAFIQAQRNQVPITAKADNASAKIPQVEENTQGVAENEASIFDIADIADENTQAIFDLAETIEEMLTESEG